MRQYEKRDFQHNGIAYEVRIVTDGQTIWVRAFQGGRAANGYTYSVALETQIVALTDKYPSDLVVNLIEIAEDDVKSGRWEQYVAAVKAEKRE
jgi:hypothetical protein